MKVSPGGPWFPEKSIDGILSEIREILEGKGYLSSHRHCEELEKAFSGYVGTRHAVSASSGTGALEMILRSIGVEGKEVIVPTNTFAATAFAAIRAGGIPVFADCGKDLSMDPGSMESLMTGKTGAVIHVHIGGFVSPSVNEAARICDGMGVPLVEDAAHAQGSSLGGRKAGSFGRAAGFSFFSTKVMTTGEGGMVTTDDGELARRITVLRDQAKVGNRNYHEEIGYNWRMGEIQAIMGRHQLENLEMFIRNRARVAGVYDRISCPGFTRYAVPESSRPNFYKYVLFLDRMGREEFRDRMKGLGVSMPGEVYELPCHMQPAFRKYARGPLPAAEGLCRSHVCLPISARMSAEEAGYVKECVEKVLG